MAEDKILLAKKGYTFKISSVYGDGDDYSTQEYTVVTIADATLLDEFLKFLDEEVTGFHFEDVSWDKVESRFNDNPRIKELAVESQQNKPYPQDDDEILFAFVELLIGEQQYSIFPSIYKKLIYFSPEDIYVTEIKI